MSLKEYNFLLTWLNEKLWQSLNMGNIRSVGSIRLSDVTNGSYGDSFSATEAWLEAVPCSILNRRKMNKRPCDYCFGSVAFFFFFICFYSNVILLLNFYGSQNLNQSLIKEISGLQKYNFKKFAYTWYALFARPEIWVYNPLELHSRINIGHLTARLG